MDSGVFSVDVWGDRVGMGATDPRYCSLGGVAKENPAASPFTVANEYICGRLALMLGLPVPPGVIVKTDDDAVAYVALRFGKRGEAPPPASVDELLEDDPALAAGIVAFDCWIGNSDRHRHNFAYARGLIPAMIFDHSHALLGAGAATDHLEAQKDAPVVAGDLVGVVTDGAAIEEWAGRIGGILTVTVEQVCGQAAAADAIDDAAKAVALEWLEHRKGRVVAILKGEHSPLQNVQWPLEDEEAAP